jgi:hypothetical protein
MRPQPFHLAIQLGDLRVDRRTQCQGEPGCACVRLAEKIAEFAQGEAELPPLPQVVQELQRAFGITTPAVERALRFRDQADALVIADGLDADAGIMCQLPGGSLRHGLASATF